MRKLAQLNLELALISLDKVIEAVPSESRAEVGRALHDLVETAIPVRLIRERWTALWPAGAQEPSVLRSFIRQFLRHRDDPYSGIRWGHHWGPPIHPDYEVSREYLRACIRALAPQDGYPPPDLPLPAEHPVARADLPIVGVSEPDPEALPRTAKAKEGPRS